MKAQSVDYIQLQNIYKSKAREDLAEVSIHVRELEKRFGRETTIDEKEIEAFCKGAAFVKLINGNLLRGVEDPKTMTSETRASYFLRELENEESLMAVYLALLALDDYIDKTPAPVATIDTTTDTEESQQRKLKWSMTQYTDNMIEELKKSAGSEGSIDTEMAQERINRAIMEVARAGSSELHNISALTGGMVAQEVIKVLTRQYVPIDNTCVFDGITSRSSILKL